jgi:hypothetical protein
VAELHYFSITRNCWLPLLLPVAEDPVEESADTARELGDNDRQDRMGGSAAEAPGGARPVVEASLGWEEVWRPRAPEAGGDAAWKGLEPEPGGVGGTGASSSGSVRSQECSEESSLFSVLDVAFSE